MNKNERRKVINSYLNSAESIKKRTETAKKNGLYSRMGKTRWEKAKNLADSVDSNSSIDKMCGIE